MQKTVLVTGASSGIGEATAVALAKNGYKVYAGARRLEKMQQLKDLSVTPLDLDVTDDTSILAALHQIINESGNIDILINCAGYGSYGAVEDVPPEEALRQLEVNLLGLARITQLVLPYMRKQESGKLINITSIGGKIATPFGGWYHASKFAVEGLSDSLRNEVKKFGIDVIIIEPGGIKTEWGGIAADSLNKYSGSTAYSSMAQKFAAGLRATETKVPGPQVIGDLIVKVLAKKRPRARYHAGYLSSIVTLRRFMSDRLFDRLIMSQFK
jgi:short-subunit dehydrogenase